MDQAKILCSSNCKCVGCKNFEDSSERKTLMQLADAAEVRVQQQAAARTKMSACDLPIRPAPVSETGERLPFAFMTQEVAEATCQCLLSRAEETKRLKKSFVDMERSVLEEFGRCLESIIDSAHRTKAKQPTVDTSEKRSVPASLPPERAASRRIKMARRRLNL
ncbi:protein lin-54 homolog isoform X1 [Rhipicephalus microplus]|uniref:protein lin-54 homolog isoform X1 n=2 Tax=Rhipicephalus microplus TaxID=6941 RepID=UPI003F6B0E29